MSGSDKRKTGRAVAAAPARQSAEYLEPAQKSYAQKSDRSSQKNAFLSDARMASVTLFEASRRRDERWRLQVTHHNDRTFANFRKWWWHGDEWMPTRLGVTFPLEGLSELRRAIEQWETESGLSGPDNDA